MTKMIIAGLLVFLLFSCAENKNIFITDNSIQLGYESTLDIVTWNIKNFPKQGYTTIDFIVELIDSMDVDIIALQEIGSESDLNNLVSKLDGWTGGYSSDSYGYGLAYLYKTELIVNNLDEIDELDNYNLTRTPFLLEINWAGENIYIINNHYKCCGNGIIENVYDDEEYRRQQACIMTKNYIESNLTDKHVIVLGDFNDELSDVDSANIFQNFINDSKNYKFVDMDIAYGYSSNWSYPSWPSHLDHILITDELFDEFENEGSSVQTIHLEEYFDGGWNDYEKYISDHRPVGLRLAFIP